MNKGKPFTPDALAYDENALAPTISGRTMGLHYGKHYKGYVDKLNDLVIESDYADMNLEDIVRSTYENASKKEVFNNAGQAWNHSFFWKCLSPDGGTPTGKLLSAIERDFEGLDRFKDKLSSIGSSQFGSGWVWLVEDKGELKIENSADADSPMAAGKNCVLTIDVWEHAYYLDYQNRRGDFLEAVIGKLLNWNFAMRNFESAGSFTAKA